MATVTSYGQADALRLYDLNNDTWVGINGPYYDSVSGGEAFVVSTALAASYTADKAARSDIAVIAALAQDCVLRCDGTPVGGVSTITSTPGPGALEVKLEVVGGPSYDWDFGDATTGIGNPVQHVYALAGTYTVNAIPVASTCLGKGTVSVTV